MGAIVGLYLAIGVALLAILALRVGLHLALLHEAQDEIASDQPIFCPRCGHVVPDMSFCPHCGAATHASSRSSRAERRDDLCRPPRGRQSNVRQIKFAKMWHRLAVNDRAPGWDQKSVLSDKTD